MMSGSWASQQNGHLNSSNRTPSGSVSSRSQAGAFSSSSKVGSGGRGQSNKISVVHDSAIAIKRKSALELGSGVLQSVGETSFIKLVQWIRAERLASLPHQGSTWDTVLIRALYVAERLHKFETAIQGFAHGTNAAAELAYSHMRLLLELGHDNSDALDKAFGLFYKSALTISSLLDRSELLSCTHEVQEQLCHMYTDLLTLVVEVAVYFYKTVQSMADGEVSLDLYEVFGETLESTTNRRSHISDLIWSYQIESEIDTPEDALSIDVLTKWLSPQDRVLEMLGSDHTTFTDQLAERTGLWFQENLTNFVKGYSARSLAKAIRRCMSRLAPSNLRLQVCTSSRASYTSFCPTALETLHCKFRAMFLRHNNHLTHCSQIPLSCQCLPRVSPYRRPQSIRRASLDSSYRGTAAPS
jgi:hypothetical protein